jgi:hypothetical protein
LQQDWILEGYARHVGQRGESRGGEHGSHMASPPSSSRRRGLGGTSHRSQAVATGGSGVTGVTGVTASGGNTGSSGLGAFVFPPIEPQSGSNGPVSSTGGKSHKIKSSKSGAIQQEASGSSTYTSGVGSSSGPGGGNIGAAGGVSGGGAFGSLAGGGLQGLGGGGGLEGPVLKQQADPWPAPDL